MMTDARIPDHCAWAARGHWNKAYDAAIAEIARLTAELEAARASAAAAYERAEEALLAHGLHDDDAEIDLIRALATEAETNALAEIVDAETRACAEVAAARAFNMAGGEMRDGMRKAILARLDQRKEAGEC